VAWVLYSDIVAIIIEIAADSRLECIHYATENVTTCLIDIQVSIVDLVIDFNICNILPKLVAFTFCIVFREVC
jgi:hypothetical protein